MLPSPKIQPPHHSPPCRTVTACILAHLFIDRHCSPSTFFYRHHLSPRHSVGRPFPAFSAIGDKQHIGVQPSAALTQVLRKTFPPSIATHHLPRALYSTVSFLPCRVLTADQPLLFIASLQLCHVCLPLNRTGLGILFQPRKPPPPRRERQKKETPLDTGRSIWSEPLAFLLLCC